MSEEAIVAGQYVSTIRVLIPSAVKHRLKKVCLAQHRTLQSITHEALVRYLEVYDKLQQRKRSEAPENMPPSNL